jgi:hypothetical protein
MLMSHARFGRGRSARGGGILAGCLIALGVALVLLIIAGIYVAMNWKGWTASAMQAMTQGVVAESGLPQDQRDQIIAEVQKLGDDFKEGKISVQELQSVGKAIVESPLLHLGGVQMAKQKYIEPSTMTAEEKAAANRSLQRFARGVYEKKIPVEAIDEVIKPITTLKADGRWELKEKPRREELDQFVANCRKRAEEAKVPDEAFDLNIAKELKATIHRALGRTGS